MSRSVVWVALLALLLSACGYRLQGRADTLPGDVRSLYVELFRNNSYEPHLENSVTNEVVGRFARHGRLELVEKPAQAEGILGGRIIGYSNSALSYDQDDRIAEYRSKMTVVAVLRRVDNGEVLWKGSVNWQEEYPASGDKTLQEDREQAAIQEISRRLADELFSHMIDNF
jgi:outer membrane lipopolysaccharide assembly protein LptE/RlpB